MGVDTVVHVLVIVVVNVSSAQAEVRTARVGILPLFVMNSDLNVGDHWSLTWKVTDIFLSLDSLLSEWPISMYFQCRKAVSKSKHNARLLTSCK